VIADHEPDSRHIGADFDDVEAMIAGHELVSRHVGADVHDIDGELDHG
jgi:hypothetical protein